MPKIKKKLRTFQEHTEDEEKRRTIFFNTTQDHR